MCGSVTNSIAEVRFRSDVRFLVINRFGMEIIMLIIEDDSVYEIDEECLKKRKVPKECKVHEKLLREHKRRERQHDFAEDKKK